MMRRHSTTIARSRAAAHLFCTFAFLSLCLSETALALDPNLTDAGKRLHRELLQTVIAFNKELTAGLAEPELIRFKQTLTRLQHNVRSVE